MLIDNQRGATAIEYGLICTLIAVAMIGAMKELAGSSSSLWGKILTQVQTYM
jgi:pilus assembly protein Flp/PilA